MRSRLVWFVCSLVSLMVGCATSATPTPRGPDGVADVLAARRAVALERLRAYREAGVFPVDDRGLPTGVFRDAHGVRCPMSELIFQSGRGDLVDAVVRVNNRLRLADVHDGPLYAWMMESGLTREEIIEIQGAMEWNTGGLRLENGQPTIQFANAQDSVRNKLVTIETKLRGNTGRSVEVATSRLSSVARAHLAGDQPPAAKTTPPTRVTARP